jgi:uncharacterized protein YhaN
MVMSETTRQAEDIQQEMRQVRAELRDAVQEVVESAAVLKEWRAYVRSYPWVCLGAAAAAGYFLVPSRMTVIRPDTASLLDLAKKQKLVVKMDHLAQKPSLLRSLLGMAAGTLMQAGVALATKQVNEYLSRTEGMHAPRREGAFP